MTLQEASYRVLTMYRACTGSRHAYNCARNAGIYRLKSAAKLLIAGAGLMSDEQQSMVETVEESGAHTETASNSDSLADVTAILVIFTAAVMFCIFYISGWSFDL